MKISHGPHEWDVKLYKVDDIDFHVCDLADAICPLPGAWYWNVLATWQEPPGTPREFVLESGVLDDKVKAFTQGRKRCRHFRRERHREKESQAAEARALIPNMKGWKR